jgi:hypothetical protein
VPVDPVDEYVMGAAPSVVVIDRSEVTCAMISSRISIGRYFMTSWLIMRDGILSRQNFE